MDVQSLNVAVNVEALERTRTGSITGPIWLHLEGRDFPEKDWFDFPVALLNSWIEEVSALRRGEFQTGTIRFMEGPLTVAVRLLSNATARASFTRSEQALFGSNVDVDQFLRSAKTAGRLLAGACMMRGWLDEEVMRLDEASQDDLPQLGCRWVFDLAHVHGNSDRDLTHPQLLINIRRRR